MCRLKRLHLPSHLEENARDSNVSELMHCSLHDFRVQQDSNFTPNTMLLESSKRSELSETSAREDHVHSGNSEFDSKFINRSNNGEVNSLEVNRANQLQLEYNGANSDSSRCHMQTERIPQDLYAKKLITPLNPSAPLRSCMSLRSYDCRTFVSAVEEVDRALFCKCGSIFLDPISLPCGHTFCKLCLSDSCTQCGFTMEFVCKVNILLVDLLTKLCPDLYKSAKCRVAAKNWLVREDFEKALLNVNEALSLNPDDMLCYIIRSEINEKLGKRVEAIEDATFACERNPKNCQAFFRLGAVYALYGDKELAIDAFCLCLELISDDIALSKAVVAILDQLLTQPKSCVSNLECEREPVIPLQQNLLSVAEDDQEFAALNRELMELEREMHNPTENLAYAPTYLYSGMCSDQSSLFSICAPGTKPLALSKAVEVVSSDAPGPSGMQSCGTSALSLSTTPLIASLTESLVNVADSESKESLSGQVLCEPDSDAEPSCDVCDCENVAPRALMERSKARLVLYDKPVMLGSGSRTSGQNAGVSGKSRGTLKRKHEDPITLDDFECKLCFDVLLHPVTTPCGHVFCRECLMRTIDHCPSCPVCRLSLLSYIACMEQKVTIVVEKLLLRFCSEQYSARKKSYERKMEKLSRVGIDDDVEVPIFVCMIAFPTLQYPLHVFEPRYKLMIRQCLQSGSRRFGMCEEDSSGNGYADIGTILEIKSIENMPDGRFVVHASAWRRFLVRQRMVHEGCDSALVTYFNDETEQLDAGARLQLQLKCRQTYDLLVDYIGSLGPAERGLLVADLGQLPPFEVDHEHGVPWMWYGLAALPLNKTAKLVVLRSRHVSERLVSLERFLKFVGKLRHQDPTAAPTAMPPTFW